MGGCPGCRQTRESKVRLRRNQNSVFGGSWFRMVGIFPETHSNYFPYLSMSLPSEFSGILGSCARHPSLLIRPPTFSSNRSLYSRMPSPCPLQSWRVVVTLLTLTKCHLRKDLFWLTYGISETSLGRKELSVES